MPLCTAKFDACASRFTGKERDTESGNDYFEARYYSSSTGRFLSPDWSAKEEPIPYAKLDNPQSLNLYAYVLNIPLTSVDPDGHCCWDYITGAVGEALNVVPDTANLAIGALNATSYRLGGPQIDQVERIRPDNNHDSQAAAKMMAGPGAVLQWSFQSAAK